MRLFLKLATDRVLFRCGAHPNEQRPDRTALTIAVIVLASARGCQQAKGSKEVEEGTESEHSEQRVARHVHEEQ